MRLLALSAVAVLAMLLGVTDPAHAHGALTSPVSRSAACGEVGTPDSPVCRAARAASGGAEIDWSNLRLPGVNGRDRSVVPDGKLCSAGKPEFAGLDLVRRDWPVTRLTSGARMTFRYGETIPHEGTFRLYLTKPGYDPSQPLRWADLETRPFLTVTDPPLRGEAYTFAGSLPTGRTGRQLIYTIWQNSSTADTYYSCSDVLIASVARAAAPPPREETPTTKPTGRAATEPSATQSAGARVAAPAPPGGPGLAPAAQPRPGNGVEGFPILLGGALAAAAVLGTALTFVLRRRGRRSGRH